MAAEAAVREVRVGQVPQGRRALRRGRLVAQEVGVPCLEMAAKAIAQLHQRRRGRQAGYMAAAAAAVLAAVFGAGFAFDDATHADDGIKPRHFGDFESAAAEAAASRLYGGIHFRAANENGLRQGVEVGTYINALKTLA